MVKQIPLQNYMFALVDDEDYERCMKFNWAVNTSDGINLYVREANFAEGLSHFILGLPRGSNELVVTYLDKNPLNCQKHNLKIVSHSYTTQSRRGNRNTSSNYKGVHWHKGSNKWRACIRLGKKIKHLGLFETEEEAATTYNEAALKFFGEHAYQNIIGQDNSARTISVERSIKAYRSKKRNTSKYRGVCWDKNKWRSVIYHQGKQHSIGRFTDEIEAAKAYDKRAIELFGDKAVLNFPKI